MKNMMLLALTGLLSLTIVIALGSTTAGITAAEALVTAKQIWGPTAIARKSGVNYQVGCGGSSVTIVASSKVSWEDAFKHVDMNKNGRHEFSADVRDAAGNITTSAPVIVYACNK